MAFGVGLDLDLFRLVGCGVLWFGFLVTAIWLTSVCFAGGLVIACWLLFGGCVWLYYDFVNSVSIEVSYLQVMIWFGMPGLLTCYCF